jgi:NAD-dependent SIR2 family protein deacetylase
MRKRAQPAPPERTVLFLGAGASKDFGYPLTGELFPLIRERLRTKKLFPLLSNRPRESAKMQRLTDHLEQLLPAVWDESIQLPLITDVLSLVDLLLTTGETAVPRMTAAELQDFRTLLEEAVIQTIESSGGGGSQAEALDRLTDWILNFEDQGRPPLTIVSTNYDVLVESLLFPKMKLIPDTDPDRVLGESVDMGFGWREHDGGHFREPVNHPPSAARVRLLKLHGSLSWLKCPLCGFIYVNTTGSIIGQAFREDKVDSNNTCICGHGPVRAVLVAPSMVRSVQEPNLLTIWRSALEALRVADEWIIAGYSLPPEDIAIRSILLRAHHGRGKRPPPRILVVQLEPDEELKNRYRLLFPGCEFTCGGFAKYVLSLPKGRHYPVF